MSNDPQNFVLSIYQKRQAAMLYHWTSDEYLKELILKIDHLVRRMDGTLDTATQQNRDAIFTDLVMGARNTPSNWGGHVYPAFAEYRLWNIMCLHQRSQEIYKGTGSSTPNYMLSNYSGVWMTAEEKTAIEKEFEEVYSFASDLDEAIKHRRWDDFSVYVSWEDFSKEHPKIPKFKVRTDIEGETGQVPPRTGVYVCQDDPYATLMFGWKGGEDGYYGGRLPDAVTFNDLGLEAVQALGRDNLWEEDQYPQLYPIVRKHMLLHPEQKFGNKDLKKIDENPDYSMYALSYGGFTNRPAKWYFVERIEGEWEDAEPAPERVYSVEGGKPCTKDGYWFTLADKNPPRYFKAGEIMPQFSSSWGGVFWQYAGPDKPAPPTNLPT